MVGRFLAGQAQAHAGDRLPPGLRDRAAAVGAVGEPGAAGQAALRPPDAVGHGGVDLILYGAVAGPASGHGRSALKSTCHGPHCTHPPALREGAGACVYDINIDNIS